MTKFRKIVALIASVSMMIGVLPQVAFAGAFSDVPDTNEFATYINDLYNQGVVSGVGSTGMYMPLRDVSRGEMMKMVMNSLRVCGAGMPNLEDLLNVPLLPGAPHFEDVPVGSSFYEFVEQAYAMGIVQGRRAPAEGMQGLFGVDASVLRQEAMKMAINGCRKIKPDVFVMDLTGGPSFDDVSASSEFYDFIQTAYNLGIVNGYGNSRFGPMDPMRRDQMAKVVSNMLKVCREGKPLSVGVPAQILVESSDPKIKNDGTSTSTITCTVVDRNGNRVGDWTDPFTFTTDLGTLRVVGSSEPASSTKSVSSDKGRAQISLISSTTEGMATVNCKTKDFTGMTKVEFTSSAPGIRNGFGSSQISGIGELSIRITDDHIVASREVRPTGANIAPVGPHTVWPVNGFATVEAFMYDDEGDPTCGDELLFNIKEGNANLVEGNNVDAGSSPPVPGTFFVGTPTRSLLVPGGDPECVNGRYVVYVQILTDQNAGDVVIQVTNLDVSPSLITEATLTIDLVRLEAKVYDNDILTRNSTQISAAPTSGDAATSQNIAPVLIKTLDEHNEPFLTSDSLFPFGPFFMDEIECRFVGGPTTSALLEGQDGTPSAGPEVADYIDGSAGLYVLNVIAGANEGTLEVECRDIDAIGRPAVRFTVGVHAPEVELFVSSREVAEGQVSAIFARVLDGNKPVTGEELRLQIEGGDGTLDTYDGGSFDATDASSTFVRMDHICYDGGDSGPPVPAPGFPNLLLDLGGAGAGLGEVAIEEWFTTCGATASTTTDSGWYVAMLFAPPSAERDQTQALRVTDISRSDQPQDQIDLVVSASDNPSDVDQLEVHPLTQEIGVNQDVPVVVFAQDQDGFGVPCFDDTDASPGGADNGEPTGTDEEESGCSSDRNGFSPIAADAATMNDNALDVGTVGALRVHPTASENVFILARAVGVDASDNAYILNNIGGGAYFFVTRAKDRADRGEVRIDSFGLGGGANQFDLVQFNIVPNSVEAEFNAEDVMPDWLNTFIVFVSDWNDDPVMGLNGCRVGAFPTNDFTDFVITRSGPDVGDIDSTDDDFPVVPATGCPVPVPPATDLLSDPGVTGHVLGTGLYLWNVELDSEVVPGDVTLQVSLNQATNPEDEASFEVTDPTVEFDAWPQHVTSSNVIPLTVIVRDDDGDPITFDMGAIPDEDDNILIEILDGSGQLSDNGSNATGINEVTPDGGISEFIQDTLDGVFATSYVASAVPEDTVEFQVTVEGVNSRVTDSLTLPVD